MSRKKSIIEKIASGKGFYIAAALSFIMIVAAIALVYNSSVNMLRELDIPTTAHQAEKNQQGISDPRAEGTTKENLTQEYSAEESATAEITRQSTVQTTTMSRTQTSTSAPEVTQTEEVFANESYIYPLKGDIDRAFSMSPVYDETMGDWRIHKGTDFTCEAGEEVASIGNGRVVKVIADPVWGYCIEVDYGDFIARYCGMEQGTTVIIDDIVSKGDIIGKVGSIPCESSQENHLHFEIIRNGAAEDPIKVLG